MDLIAYIRQSAYPGRGILVGKNACESKAILGYFITGRSENSRNRLLLSQGAGAVTKAFDEAKVSDPSLIFYAPVRLHNGKTIITNGDQTDTIFEFLAAGETFQNALETREEEPDAPHFTPRISALVQTEGGLSCTFATLRRENGATVREYHEFANIAAGEGRLLHTYTGGESPLPSFRGEPKRISLPDKHLADLLWDALGEENRVALWMREIDLSTGKTETIIKNRHKEG